MGQSIILIIYLRKKTLKVYHSLSCFSFLFIPLGIKTIHYEFFSSTVNEWKGGTQKPWACWLITWMGLLGQTSLWGPPFLPEVNPLLTRKLTCSPHSSTVQKTWKTSDNLHSHSPIVIIGISRLYELACSLYFYYKADHRMVSKVRCAAFSTMICGHSECRCVRTRHLSLHPLCPVPATVGESGSAGTFTGGDLQSHRQQVAPLHDEMSSCAWEHPAPLLSLACRVYRLTSPD